MLLRRADERDADAIVEVNRSARASLGFLPNLHTPEEGRAFFHDFVLVRQEVWVAEEAGRVIGFVALSAEMLEHLYVAPGEQGRGIGSALLDRAKERRPGGFTFWVFQQNEGARRFYEERGCRIVRVTDGTANEERLPDALYAWRR